MKSKSAASRGKVFLVAIWGAVLLPLTSGNAYAMHITEGILPFNWAVLWFAVSAPFVGYGLYRLKKISHANISF